MKKKHLILSLILSVLLLVLFFLNSNKHSNMPGTADDLMESVFRYQFTHNGSAKQNNACAYYLGINNDQDPSDRFTKRFEKSIPPVKKLSQSRIDKGLGQVVKDSDTGQEGIIFRIISIRWLNEETVEVKGGYYEANLSASGNTYRLIRIGRYWIVIKDTCNWCS